MLNTSMLIKLWLIPNSVDLPYGRQVMMTCADSADNPLEPPRPSS
jgi:hypothetical protein